MTIFFTLIKHDLKLHARRGGENIVIIMFFILTVSLFPFGIGHELEKLSEIGSGIIWVCALFSVMLSLERVFQIDYEDGSIELLAIQPVALEIIILAKVLVHWVTTGVALIFATPILSLLMNIQLEKFWVLLFTLIIGTPSLSLIGAMGAALIIGSKKSGILISLIVLPLYLPILIFGVSGVNAIALGVSAQSHLLLLTAILLISIAFCPWVIAIIIRQALDH